MRSRTARAALALAVAGLVLGAAACSGPTGHSGRTDRADGDSGTTLTSASASTVTVADDADAAARAIATSTALFHRARGVVVAAAGDEAATKRAAALAAKAHVPALLVGKDRHAVTKEIARLGASWWVPVGDVDLSTDAKRTTAADATDGAEAIRASRPVTVVMADVTGDPIPMATAEAADARVVRMPDGTADPAAAPDVVTALAKEKASATVLVGSAFSALPDPAWTVRAAESGFQLAHGGQRPFDGHRYVALYGAPGAPSLGVLGEQGPAETVARAQQMAAQYAGLSDEPVTPTLEVITTVAAGAPGTDGDYSTELPPERLEPYLDAAHAAGMPVILDLQPGRSDFLSQAKRYESLLSRPDVWLALDPEWRLTADQVPLKQIGSVGAAEVNSVSEWLAGLVRAKGLPPKVFVLHQFRLAMLPDRSAIDVAHPELDTLIHVDGSGSQPDKQATWNTLHQDAPAGVHWGWKNFFDEDSPMLTPQQTMSEVHPTPSLITYQ